MDMEIAQPHHMETTNKDFSVLVEERKQLFMKK